MFKFSLYLWAHQLRKHHKHDDEDIDDEKFDDLYDDDDDIDDFLDDYNDHDDFDYDNYIEEQIEEQAAYEDYIASLNTSND